MFVLVGVGQGSYFLPASSSDPYGFNWLLLIAFIPYGLGLWVGGRAQNLPSKRTVIVSFAFVALLYVLAPPIQSHDVYQFMFYGKMQAIHGANPYIVPPSRFAGDPWFHLLGWPGQVSVYGPLWNLTLVAVARVWGTNLIAGLVTLKAFAALLTGLVALGIARASDPRGKLTDRAPVPMMAFALNPLVLAAGPLGGHPDTVVAFLFVAALLAHRRERWLVAALLIATASLIKAYAVFVLAIYLYALFRRRPRHGLGAGLGVCALAALAYAPYWVGWRTISPLLHVARQSSASLTGTVQSWLDRGLSTADVRDHAHIALIATRSAAGALLLAVTIFVLRSRRTIQEPFWGGSLLLAAFFLVTPWYLPWYVVGLLAAVLATNQDRLTAPVAAFTATQLIQVPGLANIGTVAARYAAPIWMTLTRANRCD